MTALDFALIQNYTNGINAPIASEAGYTVHVDAAGTNLEYHPQQQIIAGSGTWDGKSPVILVTGSGARSITLPLPSASGRRDVQILDVEGTSDPGTITAVLTGATLATGGTASMTSNYARMALVYVGSTVWMSF
jgi:hypothetical protein